jgi:hypothetical protein
VHPRKPTRKRKAVDLDQIPPSDLSLVVTQKVKLEPPEVFLSTPMGFQFVSRPEFSDEELDNFIITISSDESA